MPLLINVRHLEHKSLQLRGELAAAELDLDSKDEMLQVREPVKFNLEAQELENAVLVQGTLALTLDCQCVRCLKPFKQRLKLNDWVCHIPLKGEDAPALAGDCADLTPYLREDIFLALPQHPLCKSDCRGLPGLPKKVGRGRAVGSGPDKAASPWAALDKLKL